MGSAGDVHPFLGIGRRLKERGHRVTLAVNAYFRDATERAGLGYIEMGDAESFTEALKHPDIWKPGPKSLKAVLQFAAEAFPRQFEVTERFLAEHGWAEHEGAKLGRAEHRGRHDNTSTEHESLGVEIDPADQPVVLGASIGYGPRITRDKHVFPFITLHLAPVCFQSCEDPPRFKGMFMPRWLPRPLKRATWWLGNKVADRFIAPSINAIRQEQGLPPAKNIVGDWMHSPDRVLALFPAWFAPPPSDWPRQVKLTGFPRFDEPEHGLSDELTAFLEASDGDKDRPIAFAPGSANRHARAFFEHAAKACQLLGRRGLLMSKFPEQVPKHLPKGVMHVPYAPFSQLLPRCAAIVHHGGVGTLAQSCAAGIPQLIHPLAHDQFDNALRLQRLGIGDEILPKHCNPKSLAGKLAPMLANEAMQQRCREVAMKFEGVDAVGQTCEEIERVAFARSID